ncbi:hypothetical protein IC213_15390 [Clostridioides sp. ES-S-0049-02]|uniref:hypothetical protein n=1 Tax=Clostridioides sp. ES-S-0049-02 TaxID=2770778 RepID=UPI001D12548D|nr:hypothetical protein [Clostridioides sp. ES-S-0049-02]
MLLIVIIAVFIIALINIIILGKENIKGIIIPVALFLVSDFLFLCGNIILRGGVILLFIGLFAIPLMLIAFIWICVHIIKLHLRKDLNKRKVIGCIVCTFISISTIFLPGPSESFRFQLYKKDYIEVAQAVLKACDEKKLNAEYNLNIKLGKKELENIFSEEVVNKINKLNRNVDVTKIVGNKKSVCFFFGAELQSVDGIVFFKDLKGNKPELDFINKHIQAPRLEYMTDDVYYFKGGL